MIRPSVHSVSVSLCLAVLAGCSGSKTPDGGMDASLPPGLSCDLSCDPTSDSGCASGQGCAVVWQLTSTDTPVSVASSQIGVCTATGTYANNCVTNAVCPNGLACEAVTIDPVTAKTVDTTFDVETHMLAAVEMQLAGEPLAESMGRLLGGYSRDVLPTNIYFDASPQALGPWIDLVGFGTAVESYEYSKQPMNELNFESGAGVSMAYGPLVNPMGATGMDAVALVNTQEQEFAQLSGLVVPAGTPACTLPDGGDCSPIPIVSFDRQLDGGPPTILGWPGFWPTMHPYESFDPTIHPSDKVLWECSISSDDTPGSANLILDDDYECDYTSLNLPSRSSQIAKLDGGTSASPVFAISPGSSGWAGWKSALWVMNYLQIMHDVAEDSLSSVPADQVSQVGVEGNTVVGTSNVAGGPAVPGAYLGSSNIEGFQAANMINELDNQAEHWLTALTTTDGVNLSSFPPDLTSCMDAAGQTPTTCDPMVMTALGYDFTSPLRWIPKQIAVTEDNPDLPYGGPFPQPTSYSIATSDSDLLSLDGLLGTFSSMYSLTDRNNAGTGGSQTAEVYFSGTPFPLDDGQPDGEQTLHDRSLAMMRFVTVTLDRLHSDPTSGVLVDDVTFSGNTPTRGQTVATSSVAYTIVALRNVRRSLASLLQLYSNNTPDETVTSTPLDDTNIPFNGAPGSATFTGRLNTMLNAQASLLLNQLTTPSGQAYDGWNVAMSAPVDMNDTLDAHTAAIRGLLASYLSTGNETYRTRAVAVFNRMDSVFYDPKARMYDPTPTATLMAPYTVAYTPMRFAMLEGSLRDLWELVGAQPGQTQFGQLIQIRLARLIKLILNGWDDRNTNQMVDWSGECMQVDADAGIDGGLPLGGLQMAERALSGELGSLDDDLNCSGAPSGCVPFDPATRVVTTDRDSDCVPNIAARGLPSALANEVDFTVSPP